MNSHSFIFKGLSFYGNRLAHPGNERILNFLRRLTRADVDEDLPVQRRGRRWILNPSDFVQGDVFWTGYKDYWDVWHLERLLPRDGVVVDVGANFGYYSVELAMALGAQARIVAFEPFPQNYARLEHHIRLNELAARVQTSPLALSDASGSASMAVRHGETGNTGSAQLRRDGLTIRTAPLDEVWPGLGHDRLDLIKIDVEGHEAHVLRGARGVIDEYRPMMLVEIDPPRLLESGSSTAEVIDLLRSFGYQLFNARRRQLVPVGDEEPCALVNTFCIHPARHPRGSALAGAP